MARVAFATLAVHSLIALAIPLPSYFRAFAREPALFSRLLMLHARALPARTVVLLAPRLLWRLAVPAAQTFSLTRC